MPSRTSVMIWAILLGMTVFFLMPHHNSHGQGVSRFRSSANEKHNADTSPVSQHGNDPVAIPWNSLDAHSTKRIRDVMDGKTFYRRMPQQLGYCDAEMYDFMVCHPDVVVELWELLGVTQISLSETGPNKYLLKEGTSTTSQVEVLYKSKNLCIVYASGEYEAPMLLRKIKGDVILLLKSRYGRDKENRPVVQCDLDTYVRIHNPGAEMLAKILLPVVGKIADSNFEQTVGFVMNVSEAAQDDFERLAELAQRMKSVRPQVAKEFAFVAEAVFDREADRFVALANDARKSVAELAHPLTPSAAEASAMPKYARQPDRVVTSQEVAGERLAAIDSRMVDLLASPLDLDARLIPLSTGEIRRETLQKQQFTTAGTAVQAGKPSVMADSIMNQSPRRLTITNDGRSIIPGIANSNEQPKENRRQGVNVPIMTSVPAFGQTTRSELTLKFTPSDEEIAPSVNEIAPSVSKIVSRDAVTKNGTSSNQPTSTNLDRVMIRTISPSQSSTFARSTSQYQAPAPDLPPAPTPGIVGQAPSPTLGITPTPPLGTPTPTAPQPSESLNSQFPDKLPLPVYLPK